MRGVSKGSVYCGVLFLLSLASSVAYPAGYSADKYAAGEIVDVTVKNFPDVQKIKGSVAVEGTISHSKFVKWEGLMVRDPAGRDELTQMFRVGTINTDGFSSIAVSLQGEIYSGDFTSGTIGVLILPNEGPIFRAIREGSQIQFPIEATCDLKAGGSTFFNAPQVHQRIAFPSYIVYIYNTLNRAFEANVYLYLTH